VKPAAGRQAAQASPAAHRDPEPGSPRVACPARLCGPPARDCRRSAAMLATRVGDDARPCPRRDLQRQVAGDAGSARPGRASGEQGPPGRWAEPSLFRRPTKAAPGLSAGLVTGAPGEACSRPSGRSGEPRGAPGPGAWQPAPGVPRTSVRAARKGLPAIGRNARSSRAGDHARTYLAAISNGRWPAMPGAPVQGACGEQGHRKG